jgi:hypothetical protein
MFPHYLLVTLIRNGVKIPNLTSPLLIRKNITLTIIDCCASPPVRLTVQCVAASLLSVVSVISSNPITIGSAIPIVTEIYENC